LEAPTSGFLAKFGLQSIRSKITIFALISTLIPSLAMGWLSYVNNKRFLSQKINQEIQSVTSQTSREIDLWFKEKLYDIRVFSKSFVVSKNLSIMLSAKSTTAQVDTARLRITDYLQSVRGKFVDYAELLVVDQAEKVAASSATGKTTAHLPENWPALAVSGKPIVGAPVWDASPKTGTMTLAAPIFSASGQFLGVLAAKLKFQTLQQILDNSNFKEAGNLYVITSDGTLLAGTQSLDAGAKNKPLSPKITTRLFALEEVAIEYRNSSNIDVIGALNEIHRVDWGIVAELEKEKAYAEILHLRNITIAFVAGILLVVGLSAYILGLTIVGPLNRLIQGADKVASGDLEVRLPPITGGELGFMTRVFNHMVDRLRQGRDTLAALNQALEERNIKLKELSVTDRLTGLFNRGHLHETIVNELARSSRHKNEFGILMLDIDHFKQLNDNYGHQVGDDVLQRVSSLFRSTVRDCDYVARYGGEEFLVMLPETTMDKSAQAGERIRSAVEKERFTAEGKEIKVTISIGVSCYPHHGTSEETLIQSADAALYEAKRSGRNRVVSGEPKKDADAGTPKKRAASKATKKRAASKATKKGAASGKTKK
jgi:diguanylate cyclase (GGDEF)-like protein